MALIVRKMTLNRNRIYWVGNVINGVFVPYCDIYGPTGYGHSDKEIARKIALQIEERLKGDKDEKRAIL